VGERAGTDVEEGLNSYGTDEAIYVYVAFVRGFQLTFQCVEMGDNILGVGPSSEKVEYRLSSFVMWMCFSVVNIFSIAS
jgi:hypothetical protein